MSCVNVELVVDEWSPTADYFTGQMLFEFLRIFLKQFFHLEYLLCVHELIIDILSLHPDDVQPTYTLMYFSSSRAISWWTMPRCVSVYLSL